MKEKNKKMSLTNKLKGKIGKGLVSLTALAGGIGLAGCETTPAGYALGAAMVNTAVGETIRSGIKGQLDPSGTNVTINQSNPQYIPQPIYNKQNEVKLTDIERFNLYISQRKSAHFVCDEWKDLNNNGRIDNGNELIGLDKTIFSFSQPLTIV